MVVAVIDANSVLLLALFRYTTRMDIFFKENKKKRKMEIKQTSKKRKKKASNENKQTNKKNKKNAL